jgi:hypothetical protein
MSKIKALCMTTLLVSVPLTTGCGEEDGAGDTGEETGLTATTTATITTTTGGETGDTAAGDGDGDVTTGDGDATTATTGDGDGETTGMAGECGLDGLTDPGPVSPVAGQTVHHFTAVAHNGEMVNICQFAGKKLMLDKSAEWCGPCHSAAACISGNDAECGNLFQGGFTAQIEQLVTAIRGNLQSGAINWVTVLFETQAGAPPSVSNAQAWDAMYAQDNVWVMADSSQISNQWLPASGIPYFVSVDANFNYLSVNNGYEWSDMANP